MLKKTFLGTLHIIYLDVTVKIIIISYSLFYMHIRRYQGAVGAAALNLVA